MHYVEHNFIWDGETPRTLTSDEREPLHDIPVGYTRGLTGPQGEEDARAYAKGNRFHIPSIIPSC